MLTKFNNYSNSNTPMFFGYDVAKLLDGVDFFMAYNDVCPQPVSESDFYMTKEELEHVLEADKSLKSKEMLKSLRREFN
jgi:hypothetical protein